MIVLVFVVLIAGSDPQRADLADLHPVTGPEAPTPLPPTTVWPWFVLAGGIGLGLSGWLAVRRWSRPRREPPPHAWAGSEFDRLALGDWSDPAVVDRFAQVVRSYLYRRAPAARNSHTSNELAACLAASDLGETAATGWKSLLDRCDLAKFARTGFTAEESAETLRRAQSLLAASLPKSETATPGQTGEAR